MRILFLCGSLEPGCDGVGDYTRLLASELIKMGHQASGIALYDNEVKNIGEEVQERNDIGFPVLRIPVSYPIKKRFSTARHFIQMNKPDWVSFQYVPYSFHNKGIPYILFKNIEKLKTGSKWHIMFHELWIGTMKKCPVKHKIVGYLQRRLLEAIVKKVNPELITTTNRLYQCMLSEYKINSKVLPLFSNISVSQIDMTFYKKVFHDLSISYKNLHEWKFIGIFGSLHLDSNLEEAIEEQLHQAEADNKQLAFIGVGKVNERGEKELMRLKEKFGSKVKFLHLGKQPAENVSNLLQLLDVGISCTPLQYITRSGVYAAMKLHDLKVVVPNVEINHKYQKDIIVYNEKINKRPKESWSAAYISDKFLNLLHYSHDSVTY